VDNELRRFISGEVITIREMFRGALWTARPVTVIEDTNENFVSYLAPGTLIDYPVDVEHGEKCFSMWLSGDWKLRKRTFKQPGILLIAPQGMPFVVFANIRDEGGVSSWYVNFQEPLRRTRQGFDTMDETIDLLVAPDFSDWHRKDEDELELAVSMGVYEQEHAQRLLDNCSSVEADLKAGNIPWDHRWSDWSPPKSSRDS
jgi:predicted RNA-binding protein associated with RNAse of E/G family